MDLLFFRHLALSAVVISSPAIAADLPTMKPVPAAIAATAYDWSGFYVGGYAGGAFGSARLNDVPFPTLVNKNSLAGFAGGGLAGFNYQAGALVLGVEGEFGYDGAQGSENFLNGAGHPRREKFEESYVGRIRGRLGYTYDRFLLFAAGGASFADGKVSLDHEIIGLVKSTDQSRTGFNVGAGVDYAFTQNWIGRVEYIYDNFGKETYVFDPAAGFDTRRVSLSENTVRAAVEYKF
jgi:outer membrane immunogenic protein